MRQVVCTSMGCQRCLEEQGGFSFPFVGTWWAVVADGAKPANAACALGQSEELMDLFIMDTYGSLWEVADFCPRLWKQVLARTSTDPGCAPLHQVHEVWRRWQLGSPRWVDPARTELPECARARQNPHAAAHVSIHGWMAHVANWEESYLPAACQLCGSLSRHVCRHCLRSLCRSCDEEFPLFYCCDALVGLRAPRVTMPAIAYGQPGH